MPLQLLTCDDRGLRRSLEASELVAIRSFLPANNMYNEKCTFSTLNLSGNLKHTAADSVSEKSLQHLSHGSRGSHCMPKAPLPYQAAVPQAKLSMLSSTRLH